MWACFVILFDFVVWCFENVFGVNGELDIMCILLHV